jgi:type IV pilus assembly protein PilY1
MTITRTLAAALAGFALVVAPTVAHAQQVDVNPPLPNVMLLIDNSGSMERMIDGTQPESTPANTCNCDATSGICNWNAQPSPNRWGVLLQALTGSFQGGYNCAAMPRTPGSVFESEYKINGVSPYDLNYALPYHRPIAQDTKTNPGTSLACVWAPGPLPGAATPGGVGPGGIGAGANTNATDWVPPVQHTYGTINTSTCGDPAFQAQFLDGALDSQLDIMRFGLMTFDQDPDPGTGVTASNQVANPAFMGMWSYFPGWNTGGACTYYGNPAGCSTQTLMAVGARNPAAPPWEGRMMPFPSTTDIQTQRSLNDNIQHVLLASRPYGATPLAGMFKGAQYYFQSDPTGPQQSDTYVKGGCRSEYIILLSDGAPNLDMRPECEPPTGVCPFPHAEDSATALNRPGGNLQPVTTYVIGFAVSSFQDQGTTVYCSSLVTNGQLASVCNDPTASAKYGPCCELQKIALNGGTSSAFFADTPGDLQAALGTILSQIGKRATTRTTPAYSPLVSANVVADPNAPKTSASVFLASFIPSPGKPWRGNVQRQRYQCKSASSTYTVVAPPPDPAAGDDFAANLNSSTSGTPRTFILLQPDTPSMGKPDATATIRPYAAATGGDGIGRYSATTSAGSSALVIPSISPDAMQLTDTKCTYNPTGGGAAKPMTATQCRNLLLAYTFADPSFTNPPPDMSFVSRSGNAFGDVFHATPIVVGPPGSLLRDDSYLGFASTTSSGYGTRRQVVYVATNDGLLHAFWADEPKLENNELWALMPPAAMPNLFNSYPSSHMYLLDGSPIVKDVVWDRPAANQGDPSRWHTMLVAGFGPTQRGYYAVDVTNPDPPTGTTGSVPADPPSGGAKLAGPVFMWQLTNMPGTNAQLFGKQSSTPAITSLFMDPDGKGARQIGVAILPGGQDSGPSTSASGGPFCKRAATSTTPDSAPVGRFTARNAVRCWGTNKQWDDPVVGRSLSVVRLDTGEIVRVFMRLTDVPANDTLLAAKRITDAKLDSPMIGIPVVYPQDVGADATRVFVGDADGTVWRFDLSSSDPSKWTGELFLDLYNATDADASTTAWSDGQPVQLAPVTSLDANGNVVLNLATGSQETFDSTGVHFVYSITEKVDLQNSPVKLRAAPNWWLDPATVTHTLGERVSGPMTVFDGVLYFATYGAAQAGAQSCSSGHGRVWGLDFVQPADTSSSPDLSKGGLPRLSPPPANHSQYFQPDESDNSLLGVVIPGVSIKATPACAGLGTAGNDQYVAGAMHSQQQGLSMSSTQFSLSAQLGAPNNSGTATKQLDVPVATPASPTIIDSWAAVLE